MTLNRLRLTGRRPAVLVAAFALAGGLVGSPQQLAAQGGAPPPAAPQPQLRFFDTDARFRPYYDRVDGLRTLGRAIAPPSMEGGLYSQLHEKGEVQDHRPVNRTGNPAYDFQHSLLVDRLKAALSPVPVGGDASSVTYATIAAEADPGRRIAPPPSFTGNVQVRADGSVFVPFSADLSPAPGHVVPPYFWEFMNRGDLFPGGWLHDIGLPVTPALRARVDKGVISGTSVTRVTGREVLVQAFQRGVLTHDPLNPAGYLTELANVGTDYWRTFLAAAPPGATPAPTSTLAPTLVPTRAATATRPPEPTATPAPTSTPAPTPVPDACGASAAERQMAVLMRQDPRQRRLSLTCDPILTRVARGRAEDMARRRYFGHTNPDGYGPNYLVRQAGYPLPTFYDASPAGNNIESIAAGNASPDATWHDQWMQSSGHATHLLGLEPFYAQQVEYGIGYASDPASPYRHYWVAITARRGA